MEDNKDKYYSESESQLNAYKQTIINLALSSTNQIYQQENETCIYDKQIEIYIN